MKESTGALKTSGIDGEGEVARAASVFEYGVVGRSKEKGVVAAKVVLPAGELALEEEDDPE
jgi:hypothetical protein